MATLADIVPSGNEDSTGFTLNDIHGFVDKIATKIAIKSAKRGEPWPTDEPDDFVAEFDQGTRSLKRGFDYATSVSIFLAVWC